MVISRLSVCLALFSLTSVLQGRDTTAASVPSEAGQSLIRHHELFVELYPDTHELIAEDRLTLEPQAGQPVRLSLAQTLTVDRLTVSSADGQAESTRDLALEIHRNGDQPQQIVIPSTVIAAAPTTVTLFYHGTMNDPPKEPRHLRFVTPSETAGHVGSQGVYLSSESGWYPDVVDSLSTFRLQVAMPEGWTAVTQAKTRASDACPPTRCRRAGMTLTEWGTTRSAEALTLAANRFTPKKREWTSKDGQPIELAVYLFPEDAHLADEYLDAAARYLDAYVGLLGPYPFETFAVVENFFASGLGMPAFTLLGSGVIKRHYVQPYALGHEIVHSWIGNTVFNRSHHGNWVEGLTTYLSNYYWYELTGDQAQARQQRQLFVRGYNLHVFPERDYPVSAFRRKEDERDNAIGYQKAAMVFHLLRQEMGEEPFWTAIRQLVRQYSGRQADWSDLERLSSAASGRDLRWFFGQWVERPGAPALSITRAVASSSVNRAASFQLDVGLEQIGTPFRMTLQMVIHTEDGRDHVLPVQVNEPSESLSIQLTARPLRVDLDPDAMLLRRIPRAALPPVLNHYVTDPHRSVLTAFSDRPEQPHPFRDLIARIEGRDSGKPESERTAIVPFGGQASLPPEGSVLLLAGPDARPSLQAILTEHCDGHVRLDEQGIMVDGAPYEGGQTALLATCHRANRPGSVISVFYAMTPQAVAGVSRLLFFYGWNSVVVFQDGRVAMRGDWAVEGDRADRKEVRVEGQDGRL